MEANGLLGSARRLLLAVSGGADSTALLHAMHALKADGALNAELLCAHVNHQLRAGDADRDEEFTVAQAAELKLPVITKRVDVREYARRNKLSIETAARQLRIQALGDICRDNNCDAIVTAHQKNDNAETIIQRLARGTGFRGLAGIWPERVFSDGTRVVRPLLCAGREEIIEYLEKRNLQWRRDHTNEDCSYRRNYIRHRLIPELQRNCTKPIVEQLAELAKAARRFYAAISSAADEVWEDAADLCGNEVTLDAGLFLAQPQPVKVELARRSLEHVGCRERDLTQGHYESILQLAEQNVGGRQVELPGGSVVSREYGRLIFGFRRETIAGQAPPYDDRSVSLKVPGQTRFGKHLIEATIHDRQDGGASPTLQQFAANKTGYVERFDLDKIKLPLVVRRRRPGDRFVPLGITSETKLGKFLTAQRIPRRARDELLVIADSEKIIWVCPVRMSERAKVTTDSRTILQLQVSDLNSG